MKLHPLPRRAALGVRLLRSAAFAAALIPVAQAAVFQWNTLGPISSNWSTTSNWQGGVSPAGSTAADTVRFYANNYGVLMTGNVTANMNLAAPLVANRLVLSGRGGSSHHIVQLNGGAIQLAGTAPALVLEANVGSAAITYDVYNAIQIPNATEITSPGYGIVNLRGAFSGAGSLTIDAVKPQLTLYSASTYVGPTSITGGTVYLGTNNALPVSTDLTLASGAVLDLNVRFSGASGGNQTLRSLSGAGTVTNNNNAVTRTLTISGPGDSVFSGVITSGSGATPDKSRLNLVKSGAGTLTLAGASDFTGTTTVNGGTLVVNGSLASPVTLSGGGRLGGSGSLAGGLTLAGGARLSAQVSDAAGSPGSGWTRASVGGSLAITATASNPVVIDLATSGVGGKAAHFVAGNSYQWPILSAAGGINGFSPDRFVVNTAAFANAFVEQNLPHGAFSVEQSGNDLRVVYLPAALANLAVYKGALATKAPDVRGFERWLGRPVNRVYDGIAWQSTWTAWRGAVDNQTTSTNYSWVGVPTRYRPNLSVAMLPSDTGTGATNMAAGAAGSYNAHWTYLAEKLVQSGQGNAIIRMGWEMNLNNGSPAGYDHWKWRVANSTQATNYINYWRQIVNTMRAVPGADFLFDFCPANGWGTYPAVNSYPGDDYVDIIGLDVYNSYWGDKTTNGPAVWWSTLVGNASNYCMLYWRDFAAAHGKFTSFPEWGTGIRPNDNAGNGDDAYFIQRMHEWITNPANNVLYHTYWDYQASDFLCQLSNNQYPLAGAVFKDLFAEPEYWDADIGSAAIPGDSSYDEVAKTHTIRGTGAGIGGAADSFHFTFTPKMGDSSIVARLTGIQNTSANAVLGVMIRESFAPGSRFAFAGVTQGGVARFQHRSTTDASATTPYSVGSASLPLWVKITRVGDVFTAYRSADGVSWTNIGSQTIAMNENFYVGVALAGASSSQRNIATADNVNERVEVIVDNADPGAVFSGTWTTTSSTTGGVPHNGSARYNATVNLGSATYTPTIPETGVYDVYMWYTHGDNRAVNAPLTIVHAGGSSNINVSQRFKNDGWKIVGTYTFHAGTGGSVTYNTAGAVDYQGVPRSVIADALRFVKRR